MAQAARKKVPTWLVIVCVLVALVVIGQASRLFSSALGNAEESPSVSGTPVVETEDAAPAVEVPDYTVARIEDLSFGDTVRLQYRVAVPGEVDEAGLRAVVDDVVAAAKQDRAFNALSVGLFASEAETDGAYTLGVAELAPGGQWDAADTVEAGDYDAMELTVTIY